MRDPLPLAYYGHPVLRQQAKPIEQIDAELIAFGEQLLEAMVHYDGVGLAANQVHRSVRMFAMRSYELDAEGNPVWNEAELILNPVLSEPSEETEIDEEGCLSIPGFRGMVERPVEITLTAISIHGKPIQRRLKGLEARIAMHETDHLNGRFFHERMPKQERDVLDRKMRARQHLFGKKTQKS